MLIAQKDKNDFDVLNKIGNKSPLSEMETENDKQIDIIISKEKNQFHLKHLVDY